MGLEIAGGVWGDRGQLYQYIDINWIFPQAALADRGSDGVVKEPVGTTTYIHAYIYIYIYIHVNIIIYNYI